MADALNIPINITGAEEAIREMRALADSAERMGRTPRVSGPYQRLERAIAAERAAIGTGNESARLDAVLAQQRANRQITRAGRQGFGSIHGAISTFAPELAPLLLAGASLAKLNDVLGNIGKVIDDLRSTRAATGGSMGDVGTLGGFGGSASAARSLRERLATSPYAQAAFGTFTLSAGTGQLVNEAKLFNDVARQIVFARTEEEARIRAQVAGMEDLLPLRDADRKLTEQMLAASKEAAEAVDAPLRRARGNLEDLKRIREARERQLGIEAERELMPFQQARERLGAAALNWALHPRSAVGMIGDWVADHLRAGRHAAQQTQQAHTEALNNHAEEMQNWRRQFAGGGAYAQNAVPPGIRGAYLEKGMQNNAIRLGAFEL